jgi:adenylate cyclase
MRRATRRRVRRFLRLLLVGTLIGAAYGGFIGRTFRGTGLVGSLVGATDGATITAAIAAIELFLLPTRWGRPLQQAPFLVTFGVKWVIYGVVITVVNAQSPGVRIFGAAIGAVPLQESLERLGVIFSFAAAFSVLFVLEISQIVGPRNLRNIVLARYHRPRLEERFFLFVDVAGSTSLAERDRPGRRPSVPGRRVPPGLGPHRRLRRGDLPVRRRRDRDHVDGGRGAGRRSPDRLPLRNRGGARESGAGVRA